MIDHSTRWQNVNGATCSERVHNAMTSGEHVTGAMVAHWLGVSDRTGRRRLAALLAEEPSLAAAMNGHRLASDRRS